MDLGENNQTEIAPAEKKSRKKLAFFVLIFVLAVLVGGGIFAYSKISDNNKKNGNPPADGNVLSGQSSDSSDIKTIAEANNYFGINIFNKLLAKKPQENLFISPLSISLALTWAANGADGETQKEMTKVLGLENLDLSKVNDENSKLISALKAGEAHDPSFGTSKTDYPIFKIANSLWSDKGYNFLPDYLRLSDTYYGAKAESLDFKDSKSLGIINNWVSENTAGKIPTVLDSLQSEMYLINAIYFKSAWDNPFQEAATKNEAFHLENGSEKQVPLMNQTDYYPYYEKDGLQVVTLPYVGKKYGMTVFLPKEGTKIDDFANSMSWEKYGQYLSKLKEQKGIIKIPKFKNEYGDDIKNDLQSIGLNLATSGSADFSKMSAAAMMIEGVIHKTFIENNEKGTEAAAVTAIMMDVTSIGQPKKEPEPFKMTVDRPFYFTIEDTTNHSIIFMGVIKNPKL